MNVHIMSQSSLCVVLCLAWSLQANAEEHNLRATVERLANLPIDVAGGTLLALSDGRLMYAGGTTWSNGQKRRLREVFLYEVGANRWKPAHPLPEPVGVTLPAQLGSKRQWVLLGGETNRFVRNQGLELIEEGSNLRWKLAMDLPFRKAAAAGGVVGDELVIVGGADEHMGYGKGEATVWIGLRSDKKYSDWKWKRSVNYPGRAHSIAASTVYEDQLYVFGGFYVDHGAPLNTDEAFCYTSGNGWAAIRPLPNPCRAATAVAVKGLGIVIVGGWGDEKVSQDVLLYHPAGNNYHRIGKMPVSVAAASGLAVGRDVYLAGNENQPMTRRSDFFRLRFEHIK